MEKDLPYYPIDATKSTGVAIGDHARVIQHIEAVYNIHPHGSAPITASLKDRLGDLLERHTLFGGREAELIQLNAFLIQHPSGYMFVTGQSGFGKTAFLANGIKVLERDGHRVCYHFISRLDDIADQDFALRNLCQQLASYHDLSGVLPTSTAEIRSLYPMLLGIPPVEGEKLVIIIDGLDEAMDWTPGPDLFPRSLPEGVLVIFSAREIAEIEWLDKLGLSRHVIDLLHLKTMGLKEIANLLQKAGGKAISFAEHIEFVEAIHAVSQGDPFYLHFLVEDIQRGDITPDNIKNQPVGLDAYLEEWWDQLSNDVEINRQEAYDLLGILAVAKGLLNPKDLAGISSSLRKGALLKKELSGKLRRYLIGNHMSGYRLCHPRFSDYLTREAFNNEEVQYYLEQLLSYCARWQEHLGPYVLQYYAEHLLDIGRITTLYSLARDEKFRRAQAKVFPENPDLNLRTVQMALQGAADSDDAVAMAEFLFLHASQLERITAQESPLDALRGANLNRAWELADLYDIEHCTLWYLLLAWELKDTNRLEEAQTTLEHLQKKELPRLKHWHENYAAFLLAHAFEIDENTFITLHQKLLFDEYRTLCQYLIERGHFAVALEIAKRDWWDWVAALGNIATAEVKEEQTEEVRALLIAARETANNGIHDSGKRARVLTKIAIAQAQANEISEALKTSQEIENPMNRLKALADIAVEQAKQNQKEGAYATFASALKIAQEKLEDPYDLAGQLGIIATAQVKADLKEEARATLAIALEIAQEIDDPRSMTEILVFIAPIQVKADLKEEARATLDIALKTVQEIDYLEGFGDALNYILDALEKIAAALAQANKFSEALKTAQEIDDSVIRADALKEIAVAQAQASEFSEAFKTVQEIEFGNRSEAMKEIATAQAQASEFSEAFKTVQEIEDPKTQAEAMKEIATAQAKIGQTKEARSTFADAIKTREEIEFDYYWSKAMKNIAIAQAKVNQTKEVATFADALKTAHKIEVPSILVEALKDIAVVQADAEQIEEARATIADALETAQNIESPLSRAEVLGHVAVAQAEADQIEEARVTFADALETGKKYTDYFWWPWESRMMNILKLINNITSKQAQVDMFSFAIETAQNIESPWMRERIFAYIVEAQYQTDMFSGLSTERIEEKESVAEALRKIATTQVQTNKFSDALDTALKIENLRDQARVLVYIAAAQTQADMFSDALNTAQKIDDFSYRGKVLGYIAVAQAKADKTEEARTTFNDALEIAQKIPDMIYRKGVLQYIATAQAQACMFSDAFETAQSIGDLQDRPETMIKIAFSQAKADKIDEARTTFTNALEIAQKIPYIYREKVLWNIVIAQVQVGFSEQAMRTAKILLTERNEKLPRIAEVLVKVDDKKHFKQLLIPCASYLDSAFTMCGLLAQLYPEQAAGVAEKMLEFR